MLLVEYTLDQQKKKKFETKKEIQKFKCETLSKMNDIKKMDSQKCSANIKKSQIYAAQTQIHLALKKLSWYL